MPWVKVAVIVEPNFLAIHSFCICLIAANAAEAFDFFCKQKKDGIEIEANIERTETTTTNSIKEKPSSLDLIFKSIQKKIVASYHSLCDFGHIFLWQPKGVKKLYKSFLFCLKSSLTTQATINS